MGWLPASERFALNYYAERWVRSVKDEALSRLILFGEASLRHALHEYGEHYHHERNHQGTGQCPALSYDQPRHSSSRPAVSIVGGSAGF